jgi:RND family efflux transporter MFP subunit
MKPHTLALLCILAACREREDLTAAPPEALVEPLAHTQAADDPVAQTAGGFIGVLTPRESAEVLAPFTSTIASLEVKLGDHVDKGQPLALLDERPLREELAIAAATLKASRAEVAQADVERHAAAAALDRERRALKENVVSQAEVAAAEFADRKAGMQVARAAATVEEQRAKIAQLQARLVDTHLLAPLAGRVALLYTQAAGRVEEGHPVLRVISSDELFVKFAIPSDKVGTVAPGDEVDVVIEQQGVNVRGVVRHVAPELDPVAQMILADAELVAPPGALQSGIVCRIVPRAAHPAKATPPSGPATPTPVQP